MAQWKRKTYLFGVSIRPGEALFTTLSNYKEKQAFPSSLSSRRTFLYIWSYLNPNYPHSQHLAPNSFSQSSSDLKIFFIIIINSQPSLIAPAPRRLLKFSGLSRRSSSYRHPVVLVMEMGGDTHSFRSITYMDDVRGLLRHRGNLVNRRTRRVPRGEEGRGEERIWRKKKKRRGKGSMTGRWGRDCVGGDGDNVWPFYWVTVMLPLWSTFFLDWMIKSVFRGVTSLCARVRLDISQGEEEKRKVSGRISHLDPPVAGY